MDHINSQFKTLLIALFSMSLNKFKMSDGIH